MPERKRIAVIAVHGVGDHEQFATAREIGDLLSNLEYQPGGTPRYEPFTEVIKRLHVRPVYVEKAKTWGALAVIARAVFENRLKTPPAAGDNSVDRLDHLFMAGQLMDYKGERPEDTYQCMRLEGKRVPPLSNAGTPRPAPDAAGVLGETLREKGVDLPRDASASPGTQENLVHIYEMHWSDLSSLGNAFTEIFGELYQILFHLGSVSVNNVLAAAIHFHGKKGGKEWRLFSQAQWFSAAVLAWPIPIFTLIMAAFVPAVFLLAIVREKLTVEYELLSLEALTTVLLIAGGAFALSRVRKLPALLYPLPLLILGVMSALGAYLWRFDSVSLRDPIEEVFAGIVVALSLGGVGLIIKAYEKLRPGSVRAAAWIGAIFAVTTALMAIADGSFPAGTGVPFRALAMCLNCFEAAFGLLTASWFAFYGSYAWAHMAGARAVYAVRHADPIDYAKGRRARWTAQLVLGLSSIVFIAMSLLVWTGILHAGQALLPAKDSKAVTYEPAGALLYDFLWHHSPGFIKERSAGKRIDDVANKYRATPPPISKWADDVISIAGIGVLPIYLGALLIAGLVSGWALFPSVVDELSPPETGASEPAERIARKLREESIALGVWLTRGFKFMRAGGEVLYWTMWLPPFLFFFFNVAFISSVHHYAYAITPFTNVIGTLVAGGAVGIFAIAGRFKTLAGAFRPAVRAALDVDNWLREHPSDANPTARICGRYISLLRYISAWRDPSDKPYDSLVIIAHSQGCVITADFLRFIQAEAAQEGSMSSYDPELKLFETLPIYLFTMGCPLQQLYGLRFPFLYGWARDDARPHRQSEIPDIGPTDAPRPESLGVTRWINAYRSGDYIGRYLWRAGGSDDWHPTFISSDGVWDPPAGEPKQVSSDKAGKRIEFSIGPGAHTHYWDHTANLIAEVLDRLINEGGAEGRREDLARGAAGSLGGDGWP